MASLPRSDRRIDALAFAAHKHRDQRRKDVHASPYINHPIALAHVLAVEAGITDETVLVAAILHDTIEDTETTFEELRKRFGRTVADTVAEVTDDKNLPKQRRKELQIEHAPHLSRRAKLVKLADKICNLRDVARTYLGFRGGRGGAALGAELGAARGPLHVQGPEAQQRYAPNATPPRRVAKTSRRLRCWQAWP